MPLLSHHTFWSNVRRDEIVKSKKKFLHCLKRRTYNDRHEEHSSRHERPALARAQPTQRQLTIIGGKGIEFGQLH